MSRYAPREMTEGLSKLITSVAGFKRGEENHQRCMDYALSMIFNATYSDTYKGQVKNDVDALVEKFTINVESERARKLQASFEKLFDLAENMGTESKNNLIKIGRFLILMTNQSSLLGSGCSVIREEPLQASEEVDWHAYLNEGWERDSGEENDSDLSDWSDHSDGEEVTQVEQFSSQLATEDDTESSSDFLTSVEVGTSSVATPAKESGSSLEELNESWKACEPGYKYSGIKIDPKFPAPRLAQLCSTHSALRILSEYAVVREIIMVLRDNSACGLVFKKEEEHKYTVLGDVTVCSLSPEMFRSVMGSVTPALSMLSKIHAFVEKMLPSALHSGFQHPPKTYQAYAAALELIFHRQNGFLLRLEDRVKHQDDIMTINSCLDALRPWFKFLYQVYRVHEAATFEKFHLQQYWVCSCKLLSVLWLEAERNPSLGISSVVFSLLLISLKPYLDITENWFLFGSLDDPHEEFLISGEVAEADNNLDGDYMLHPFEQSLVDLGVIPMPLLKILANKGLTVGRSICLLRGLDCMEQTPKSLGNVSIYDELIVLLRTGLMASGKQEDFLPSDEAEPVSEIRQLKLQEEQPDALEQYTLDFILSTSDAHLLEAYGDVLNLGIETDHSEEKFTFGQFTLPFRSADLCSVQSLNHVLCESVERILEARVRGVGKLAKELLKSKCKISDHLSAVHSVAFFQVFAMHEFCSFLNEEIRKDEDWHSWATWIVLTNKLQVCLNEQHLEWSHLFSVRVAANFEPDAVSELTEGFPLMQLINRLSLHYSMQWPTHLVLNSANMKLYNDIFRFFLKIKCALSSLQRVALIDCRCVSGANAELSQRLWVLRSWVLFVLGTVHEHMLSNILLDMKQQLDERLEQASDFHSALQAHERFVRRSHFSCLLNAKHAAAQEHIMEIVGQAMVICDAFEKSSIEEQIVENMELKLNLALNFLAIFFDAISTSVNSVHLKGIAIALNEKAPTF
ncbi:gamma-tubulin complex component 5 [Cloeon dipterum]|uniref:gamma-tubulin complex component 5 n=1 Tax=Cloeon dipterum TaxID=197152 RepID=UPI0032200F74